MTAPPMLSRPPSVAAAKEKITSFAMNAGSRLVWRATMAPPSVPRAAARAQPNMSVGPTLTPTRRDDSSVEDTARKASPIFVLFRMRNTTPIMANIMSRVPIVS